MRIVVWSMVRQTVVGHSAWTYETVRKTLVDLLQQRGKDTHAAEIGLRVPRERRGACLRGTPLVRTGSMQVR